MLLFKVIALGCMWSVSKIQYSRPGWACYDDMKVSQEWQLERAHLRDSSCVLVTTFEIGSWSIALIVLSKCTRANSCVERLMQLTECSRWQRFCSIADAWWLPSTIFQRRLKSWRTMHARLCSDLAYDCNNQSSCMLVGQVVLCVWWYSVVWYHAHALKSSSLQQGHFCRQQVQISF